MSKLSSMTVGSLKTSASRPLTLPSKLMPCSPTSFLVSLSVEDGEAGLLVAVGLGCCGGGGGGATAAIKVLSRVVDDSVLLDV